MKYFITGAGGFIGSHLVEKLLEKGNEVRALVLQGTDESNLDAVKDKIEIVYGDITILEEMKPLLKGIDIVIHLAGKVIDWGPRDVFMKINYEGSKNVLEASLEAGVNRFIFMSSLSVHGFEGFKDNDENTPYTPFNAYAESKMKVEELLNLNYEENNIDIVIVRPGFIIFGPRDILYSFKQYDRICKKHSFECVSKGKAVSCYSYVENLVDGLILVSTHPKAPGETFIISDGPIISFRDLMEKMFASCDLELKLKSVPFWVAYPAVALVEGIYKLFRRKNAPLLTRYRVKVASKDLGFVNDKIVKELGFNPKIDLEEACKRTYDWYVKYIEEKK